MTSHACTKCNRQIEVGEIVFTNTISLERIDKDNAAYPFDSYLIVMLCSSCCPFPLNEVVRLDEIAQREALIENLGDYNLRFN